MELRRALLLFAIVLGLAAIAASVSRPPAGDETDTAAESSPRERSTPTAGPSPGPGPPADIAFEADLQPETRTVPTGRAATVTITAYEPGQVEIERLGLTAPVEPNGDDFMVQFNYPADAAPNEPCSLYSLNEYGVSLAELKLVAEGLRLK